MIRSRLPTRKTITENELRTAMVGATHNLALVFTVINTRFINSASQTASWRLDYKQGAEKGEPHQIFFISH